MPVQLPPCWRPASAPPPLGRQELHVWALVLGQGWEPHRSHLTEEEERRAARLLRGQDRRRFRSGRGLLRTLLGAYLGRAPASLPLQEGPHGKPYLADAPELHFNLSHSGGLVLLAFRRACRVGVDVELVRESASLVRVACRYFTPAERGSLEQVPAEGRADAFFCTWTRKEAFLKARGEGISLGLGRVQVTSRPGDAPRLVATSWDPEEAHRWSLQDVDCGPGYRAALAVEGARPSTTFLRWSPGA
jgi:4'-phosphopantetheinyl transferase